MPYAKEPEQREIDFDDLEEEFKSFVYAQNGKVTNERLALLRLLYEYDGHFSVDDILDLMRNQKFRISRATVYRTLDLLVQSGLIKKLHIEGQETRYESAHTSGHHDHIVCVDCGKIIEFFNQELETLQDHIMAEHKFKMTQHVHQLYGACQRTDCPDRPQKERNRFSKPVSS